MVELLNTTGKRVRALRQHHGWTQQELSSRLTTLDAKITNSQISHIEASNKNPSIAVLAALARALGTTTDYLLLCSDDPSLDELITMQECK